MSVWVAVAVCRGKGGGGEDPDQDPDQKQEEKQEEQQGKQLKGNDKEACCH